LAGLSIHFDAIMKKLLEVCTVKDTVGRRLGIIDSKFMFGGGSLPCRCLGLNGEKRHGVSLLRRALSKATPGTDHG
jgi:hypothetical protein